MHALTRLSRSYLRKNKSNPSVFTFDRIKNAVDREFGLCEMDSSEQQAIEQRSRWLMMMTEPPVAAAEIIENEWHLWLEMHELQHDATEHDYRLTRMAVGDLRIIRRLFMTESVTQEEVLAAALNMGWPLLALSKDTLVCILAGKKRKLTTLESLSLYLFSLAICDSSASQRSHWAEPIMPRLLPGYHLRGKKQDLTLPSARWLENTGKLLVALGVLKHFGFRTLAGYLGVSENSLRKCRSGNQLPPYGGALWEAIVAIARKGDISREDTNKLLGQLQFAHLMTAPWHDMIRRGYTEDELLSVYARIPSYHRFLEKLISSPGELSSATPRASLAS